MRLILIILLLSITINAQITSSLISKGGALGYHDTAVSLGDTNSVFTDTTTYGDWELIGSGSIDASNDSTLLYSNVPQELNPNPYFDDWSYTEEITNGGFDSDTWWDKTGSWSIGSGVATRAGGLQDYLYKEAQITIGNIYRKKFDITAYTSGDLNGYGNTMSISEAVASYEIVFEATYGGVGFGSVNFIGSIDNVSYSELVPPDGWTASTMDANNYVIQDADGLRLVSDGTVTYVKLDIGTVSGDSVYYKIVINETTGSGVKILKSNTAIIEAFTTVGTYTGVFENNGQYINLYRSGTANTVVSELSIKEYHATNNIQLPLASVDGQDYRLTMQMKEYDGSVAPQPTITVEDKSLTYSALTSAFQTYTFDFTGSGADTLGISLSDTAKVKIDNITLKK